MGILSPKRGEGGGYVPIGPHPSLVQKEGGRGGGAWAYYTYILLEPRPTLVQRGGREGGICSYGPHPSLVQKGGGECA